MVVLYDSSCLMHMGAARAGHKPGDALLGPICRRAMSSEQGNYLANLALYPGMQILLLHLAVIAALAAATTTYCAHPYMALTMHTRHRCHVHTT